MCLALGSHSVNVPGSQVSRDQPRGHSSARRSTVLGEVLPSGLQALGENGHSSTVGFGHVLGAGV